MSVASTALLIAPVALHRVLFRQHARQLLIGFSQRSALAGLALLAVAVIGVVVLIFDLVTGRTGAGHRRRRGAGAVRLALGPRSGHPATYTYRRPARSHRRLPVRHPSPAGQERFTFPMPGR